MLGAALWVTWWWLARKENDRGRRRGGRCARCVAAVRDAAWALVLPVIIIVGLKLGVFTPTEAGVVAAVYALFVSTVVYRELKLSQLVRRLRRAPRGRRAVVMFLVAAAAVSAWLITVANIPAAGGRRCCSRCSTTRRC